MGIYRDYDIVYSNIKKYLKFEQNIKKLLLVHTIFYLDFILLVFQNITNLFYLLKCEGLSIFGILLLPAEM